MAKTRVNVWISAENAKILEELTIRSPATKRSIMDAALSAYFNRGFDDEGLNALASQLDRVETRLGEIEREQKVCVETLGQYVLYWLSTMEPLSEEARAAAQAAGKRRFDFFVDQVSRKVAADDGLTRAIMEAFGVDDAVISRSNGMVVTHAAE